MGTDYCRHAAAWFPSVHLIVDEMEGASMDEGIDPDLFATVCYERDEAQAEIVRHHEDFQRIRDAIAAAKAGDIYDSTAVSRIRNIVG